MHNCVINPNILTFFDLSVDKKRNNLDTLIFFGKNSRSGCHVHGQEDYILNQIYGSKTVYMFDYYDNFIFTNNFFGKQANFLCENIFNKDHSKMKIYKVVLNEGDSLTIPPWWWHATEGNDVSCSITKIYLRDDCSYLNTKPYLRLLYYQNQIEDFWLIIKIIVITIILLIVIYYFVDKMFLETI